MCWGQPSLGELGDGVAVWSQQLDERGNGSGLGNEQDCDPLDDFGLGLREASIHPRLQAHKVALGRPTAPSVRLAPA